jgi:hypothetical protein
LCLSRIIRKKKFFQKGFGYIIINFLYHIISKALLVSSLQGRRASHKITTFDQFFPFFSGIMIKFMRAN